MKGQEMLDKMLSALGEAEREEVTAKLKAAPTQSERVQIMREVGIDEGDVESPIWLSDSYELDDEQLEMVAGGVNMPWDNEIDTNCCS